MALVLAIEPDLRQAEILTRIVREKVHADVVIVDSRDAAMEAMRSAVPDVMLLSALLSPRDEDELVAHLRTLETAEHLQTHTIPQLASMGDDGRSGPARGLLKAFRRKKDAPTTVSGCDPELFAQEIRLYLDQAEQRRKERAEQRQFRPAPAMKSVATSEPKAAGSEPQVPAASASWDSPFEWRRSDATPAPLSSYQEELPAAPAPVAPDPIEPPAFDADEVLRAHPLEPSTLHPPDPEPSSAVEDTPAPETIVAAPEPRAEDAPPAFESFVSQPAPESPVVDDEPVPEPVAGLLEAVNEPHAIDVPLTAAEEIPPTETHAPPPAPQTTSPSIDDILASMEAIDYPQHSLEVDVPDALTAAAPEADEPIAIECFIDPEPVREVDAKPIAAMISVEADADTTSEPEERIDLQWPVDQSEVALDDEIAVAAVDPEEPAARKVPPTLGPLATWARLERRAEEDRKPGSDMREIIARLAVPPHIAGVSYARGVRIRRVRVAGTRDRRRHAEQTGPVILSRRALAETRNAPTA